MCANLFEPLTNSYDKNNIGSHLANKLSKVLNDLGMKVAAVSILCQDPRVFHSMENSGTPCPFEGKIGNEATAQWLKYDKLRPDYNLYVEKLKIIEDKKKEDEAKKEIK